MAKINSGIILGCIALILAAWMMRYEIVPLGNPLGNNTARLDRWTGQIALCLVSRELRFACGE